jgi:hypothetical protein
MLSRLILGRLTIQTAVICAVALFFPPISAGAGTDADRPLTAAVRAVAPVLLVDDSTDTAADAWYQDFMDGMFGVGNWDRYEIATQGLPDPPELFLGTLAQYQGVLWYADTGSALA